MTKSDKMTDSLENNPHCCEVVAKFDHDRYLTVLYAPAEKRAGLYALYAFNYEISRIREGVSEPMLGEIRLQWWREAIDDVYQGTVRSHDILPSLAAAITAHDLPRETFMDIIEGRSQDLYDESPESLSELEDYLSQTAGNLSCLAVQILGGKVGDDLARRLGIAWGYVGLIRSVAYHLSLKKSFIPLDLMAEHDVKGKYLSPDEPEVLKAILPAFSQKAEEHLTYIRAHKKQITSGVRSAFLLSALSRSYLKTIKRADYNAFGLHEKAGAFSRQWCLLTSALFNRL
ncbi:MAG: hypothetical protein COB54_09040 [Alphaproteobacteria bacterium]|nr:MAG: hypothetical protein COB54_09040 [Alphaproteobacteria bacterium]